MSATARPRKIAERTVAVLIAAGLLHACGGGGGGGSGGGGGGGGGGTTSVTFGVELTGLGLEDVRRDEAVSAGGLPVDGGTITRN